MMTFEERLDTLALPDRVVREALAARGVSSLAVLLAVVRDRAAPLPLRVLACWVARLLKDKRAVGALVAAFDDPAPELTHQAAHALGLLGSTRAVPPLIAAVAGDAGRLPTPYAICTTGVRSSRCCARPPTSPKICGYARRRWSHSATCAMDAPSNRSSHCCATRRRRSASGPRLRMGGYATVGPCPRCAD